MVNQLMIYKTYLSILPEVAVERSGQPAAVVAVGCIAAVEPAVDS